MGNGNYNIPSLVFTIEWALDAFIDVSGQRENHWLLIFFRRFIKTITGTIRRIERNENPGVG